MKAWAVSILISCFLTSCVSVARRDVLYETKSKSKDQPFILGRSWIKNFHILIAPTVFLFKWNEPMGKEAIVLKMTSDADIQCPVIEHAGGYFRSVDKKTRFEYILDQNSHWVESEDKPYSICKYHLDPLQGDEDTIQIHWNGRVYPHVYRKKIIWSTGLCSFFLYCDEDWEYAFDWMK